MKTHYQFRTNPYIESLFADIRKRKYSALKPVTMTQIIVEGLKQSLLALPAEKAKPKVAGFRWPTIPNHKIVAFAIGDDGVSGLKWTIRGRWMYEREHGECDYAFSVSVELGHGVALEPLYRDYCAWKEQFEGYMDTGIYNETGDEPVTDLEWTPRGKPTNKPTPAVAGVNPRFVERYDAEHSGDENQAWPQPFEWGEDELAYLQYCTEREAMEGQV